MSFHLAAYFESIDSSVLAPINVVADPSLTVSGKNLQVPEYADHLVGLAGLSANLTRLQMQSPSLRRNTNLEFSPVIRGVPPISPFLFYDLTKNPFSLEAGEQLQAHVAEDAAGAAAVHVVVMLAAGALSPVSGEMMTVRVTVAQTLSVNQWTNGAMVFDQVLPVGRYAVVGANFRSTGLIAFRFLFQGIPNRPGSVGTRAEGDIPLPINRFGGLGVWGEFHSTTPPTVDFLSTSADTSEVGVLDLIRVG
ncbi:MAG: hypothetical protein ROW48_18340 [Bellilinea sp.]|jgi:hypothetical protein